MDEPTTTAPNAWQVSLRREMATLGREVAGRFVDGSDPRYALVPATRLLDPPYLRDLMIRAGGPEDGIAGGRTVADIDLTIAVSRFARQYCGAVSAAALVGLAQGIGIDMSPKRCRVALTNVELPVTRRVFVVAVEQTGTEVLRCAQRPTSLPVTGPVVESVEELREYVWSRLFGAHYDRLFRRIREVAPAVAPALLWTSAAEYVGGLSDLAEESLTTTRATPYVTDRQALLEGEAVVGIDGPNPLRGRLVWEQAGKGSVQARQLCCLNYLLPDRDGRLCANCPYLPPEDRAALIRERRDLPAGSGSGPAERRAKEVGRNRPSYRRRYGPASVGESATPLGEVDRRTPKPDDGRFGWMRERR
jgi:ferric iron reductase protein FhuF